MFDRSTQSRHKHAVRVRMTMAGSEPFDASVFLKIDERLIDLLNDSRTFIPIRRDDGAMMIVAKSNIISIIESPTEDAPLSGSSPEPECAEPPKPDDPQPEEPATAPEPPPRPRRVIDPYEVLRVDRNASIEEVKKAYKARIKAVHPDTIASFDLDEDLSRAAHQSTQKVNQAYDRIMRERQQTEDAKATGAA